jgi:hypothetical protein
VSRHLIIAVLTVGLIGGAVKAAAQEHHHPEGDIAQLGRVEFPTSCSPEVAAAFERSVAALHSFWFETADAGFQGVLSQEPQCAMAHWGIAMVMMGNPMTRAAPPPALLERGHAAAKRAGELGVGVTERERLFIDAALAFYEAGANQLVRMQALEDAFARLHTTLPDDREGAVFYGRSLVAIADPADHTFAKQLQAAALMEPLFEEHPQHPGLAHYLIHAYDAPPIADRGLGAARAYAAIAPDAPHALHMPSHIFTRLGYWDESIEVNARSALAEPDPDGAVHPMDYKVYAYLQQGRNAAAGAVVARAVQNPDTFYGGLLGYNFAAMPARYALEREAWEEAARLEVPSRALPYVEALTRFARAIGAARSGAGSQAGEEIARLEALRVQLEQAGDREWAMRVEAQHLSAAAWAAHAAGRSDEALRLAAQAAEVDEQIEKHPVTPGPLLPARELKADLLMALGRYAEAQREYERTLQREPRRARSLAGAARAAEKAGDTSAALEHYTALLEIMQEADADRPEPAAARSFLVRQGRD